MTKNLSKLIYFFTQIKDTKTKIDQDLLLPVLTLTISHN